MKIETIIIVVSQEFGECHTKSEERGKNSRLLWLWHDRTGKAVRQC